MVRDDGRGCHCDRQEAAAGLAEGRSIGSGIVKGGCTTAIGRRLKQTGDRWRLERMDASFCLLYSDLFEVFWQQVAA